MSKSVKFIVCILLIFLTVSSPVGIFPSVVTVSAATKKELNSENVFLKQQTPVTCTLASAAMLMRRTAICSDSADWEYITEENIRETAWIEGLGLRWNFTCFNITMGHGYFSDNNIKNEILNLLESNPQGFVIYNTGSEGQTHAVLLCDYDEKEDIFYVADPASNAPEGRIPLSESTIVGETQEDKIKNISAYWYIVSPVVSHDKNGNYTADALPPIDPGDNPGQYNPAEDLAAFNDSAKKIRSYYVVSDETSGGSALRTYPSGNSNVYKRVDKGTILYITYSGTNNFGATWYKTNTGYYIFSSNLVTFDEYSAEVTKFKNTSKTINATYSVNATNDSRTPMRLDPAEGNNIVAYVNNGAKLYITQAGVNSVGAMWLKTSEGYYVKNSQMKFESDSKHEDAEYTGSYEFVSGNYSAKPVEDMPADVPSEPVEYKITASSLNVRKSAVDGAVIGTLPKGTVVKVTAILSGWGRISYNGSEGWISLEHAEKVVVEQTPIKVESVKLSKDIMHPGDTVECTINIIADVACMYRYSVYNDSGVKVYSSAHYVVTNKDRFTPDTPGVYYFYIEVLSSDSRTLGVYSRNFTVLNKLQLDAVKSNVDDYIFTYDEIVWKVNAVSVSDTAVYKYSLYLDGNLLFERDSVLNILKYTPKNKGRYVLKVYVEDDFSSSAQITSDTVTVYDVLKIDSIKLSSNAVVTSESVACEIEASGGIGELSYCFTLFKDGQVVRNGAYSSKNKTEFVFSQSGNYKIFCAVTDNENTIISSFSSEIVVSDIKTGDVDGDGNITAGDARLVLRYSAGLENLPEKGLLAADVNKDKIVNAADARKILRCSANIEKL